MEKDFFQEQKKQRYLIIVFIVVTLLIIFVIWRGFFGSKTSSTATTIPTAPFVFKKIQIDMAVLKDPRLAELQPFEEIIPFTETVGRSNPFIPY